MPRGEPFTMVYDALWAMLEANEDFTDLVPVGNRIKYGNDNRSPEKDEILNSDLPEVRIVPVGVTPQPRRTSTSSAVLKRFAIQITSDTRGIHDTFHPIEWQIFKSLVDWITVLSALRWNEKRFAVKCTFMTAPEGLHVSSATDKRGITSWATVWQCEVEMFFPIADLLPAEEEEE